MQRHEKSRLRKSEHHLQFLLAGVTGNVQLLKAVINDLRTLHKQLVYDLTDSSFVAGYGGGGDYHSVARVDLNLAMPRKRHAVKS